MSEDASPDNLHDDDNDAPRLAIRRHHDRCFHLVEEVVPGGYIVQSIMIDQDDVAQALPVNADGTLPACSRETCTPREISSSSSD